MAESRFLYVTHIRPTTEKLWEALTNSQFTREYWFGARRESAWKKGSSWKLVFADGRVADIGEVLEIDPPQLLALRSRHQLMPELQNEGETLCRFEIEAEGERVKRIVRHDADGPNKATNAVSQGWPRVFSSLKSLLGTGQALSRTDRLPGP